LKKGKLFFIISRSFFGKKQFNRREEVFKCVLISIIMLCWEAGTVIIWLCVAGMISVKERSSGLPEGSCLISADM
jgi:hypothetical protein